MYYIDYKDGFNDKSQCNGINVISLSNFLDFIGVFEKSDKLQDFDKLDEFKENELITLENFFEWNQGEYINKEPRSYIRPNTHFKSSFYLSILSYIPTEET